MPFESFSQLTPQGHLKHFLTIEGLSKPILESILQRAEMFFESDGVTLKQTQLLAQKTVANLFFEPSTRTRSTFELAAKRLDAQVLNLDIRASSTSKGESLLDTVRNLEAMQCQFFVIRHHLSGAVHFLAKHVGPNIHVINAGDGWHAHPTQAMLDMYTIRKHRGDFKNLNVAIVGDVLHSRVARSQIHALNILGAKSVRVIAPRTLLPKHVSSLGVDVYHDLKNGLKDVDVIMMLRLQFERMSSGLLPGGNAFYNQFGLSVDTLKYANKDALIIHPGPINRNVEIQSEVADSKNAVILDQVTNGIAVRMAILSLLNSEKGI